MNLCFKTKKQKAKEEANFMKNGSKLLEELVASCNGRCNHIRIHSAKELKRATNNYSDRQVVLLDGDYLLCKGYLHDRQITVKKYWTEQPLVGSAITDIAISSQMSVHKNVLRLTGCCLEYKIPTLVYESVGGQTLHHYIFDSSNNGMHSSKPLSWIGRLRIAMDIASAVAYLHTAFSRPIIHRNIRPQTIIVDQNYVAKLVDFSLCLSIPEGETHIAEASIVRRKGFLAPEYDTSGYVTEKVDTYSFGWLLLMTLTGREVSLLYEDCDLPSQVKHAVEMRQVGKIVDPRILNEGIQEEQWQTFATVALSCVRVAVEDRPMMIDVARELRQVYRSTLPTSTA